MRSRLPLVLIALTMLCAFAAAGCGEEKSSEVESVPELAAPAETKAKTGSESEPSKTPPAATLDSCLEAADKVSDSDQSESLKKSCRDSYDNINGASKQIEDAKRKARAQCREAAGNIPDADARSTALKTCAKIK